MKPATCSCRVTTSLMREVRSASRRSRFSSPGTPKMHSTPSFSSARTIRSAPFTADVCMAEACLGELSRMSEMRGDADHAEFYVLGLPSGPSDHRDDDRGPGGDKCQPDSVVATVAG